MKTVVGLVASYKEAEVLMQELIRNGFNQEEVEIIGMQSKVPARGRGKEDVFQSVEEFFGTEEAAEVRGYYAKNARPGGMIVSVFVEDHEVDRATDAMVRHGAVRVYSHSTENPCVEELPLKGRAGGLAPGVNAEKEAKKTAASENVA